MVYKIIFACLALAAVATGVVYIMRHGLSAKAKQILLGLVTIAEEQFGAGTGEIKLSAVAGWLYSAMPSALQFLFSSSTVETWINCAVEKMKEKLTQ